MKINKSEETQQKVNKKMFVGGILLIVIVSIVAVFSIFANPQNMNVIDEAESTKTMTYKQLEEGEQEEESSIQKEQGIEKQSDQQEVEAGQIGDPESGEIKLIKTDAETGELLPNTKFAIYNVDNGEVPARNSEGELVGTPEIINGTEYNVVTTDENGQIAIDLPQGLYKAIEVKASHDKYALADATYFGIGVSREATLNAQWATSIGECRPDGTGNSTRINSVASTRDGGYIVGGYFEASSIQVGNYTLTKISTGEYSDDAMIIKYNANKEVEWATSIGSRTDKNISIESVSQTKDGGYIAGGKFSGSSIQVGEYTLTNASWQVSYTDGMLIKYNKDGTVEWATSIGGINNEEITFVSSTRDGGYIVGGHFSSSIQVGEYIINAVGYQDVMLIKYDAYNKVEWATSIESVEIDVKDSQNERTYIKSIAQTNDGGYIVGGNFDSNSIQVGDYTLTNANQVSNEDGMLIKYNNSGEVEWATSIGGTGYDDINTVASTRDGGYIVGGHFDSRSIQVGEYTLTSVGYSDGMLIKYNADNEVEWATTVGGDNNDEIYSVVQTKDGGYIAGGYFKSSSIQIGEYTLTNAGSDDGMLIKYNSNNEVECITSVGGSKGDGIRIVAETVNGGYIAGGYLASSSIQVGEYTLTSAGKHYDAMLIEYTMESKVLQQEEITIQNEIKTFKITTEVEKIDGVKGGNISGENQSKYEEVKYAGTSTKEIKMTPNEGFEIIKITINGESIEFKKNEDGTYILPQFTNMLEDKHIVVTYLQTNAKFILNKKDEDKITPLEGAEFKIEQIDERENPVLKEIQNNGQEYATKTVGNGITEKLGELTNNGAYYFIKNEDGTFTPNNKGIGGKTANSYITIDLSEYVGEAIVVINARVSSESNYDYGYATITQTTIAPLYNNSTGQFMKISGETSNDYTSMALEGGNTYYLHLGYRKDGSGNKGEDRIVINSIGLYEYVTCIKTYSFENIEGKYVSNNQEQSSTVANSYIPIDLRNSAGKYNIVVNAKISSQAKYDYGYATITENTDRPAYNNSTGRFIYISGEQQAKEYIKTLDGGKLYYLHLGYYKNASTNTGTDTFTINSVEIKLNGEHLYNTEVTTDKDGQGFANLPIGKYRITEEEAPEGYIKLSNPIIYEMKEGQENEITITNTDTPRLIVHHYLEGTGVDGVEAVKVAEDESYEGTVGGEYTTSPLRNLGKYTLIKDENDQEIMPENWQGTYTKDVEEVTYYYTLTGEASEITSEVTITGADKITAKDEEVNYVINYTATVNDYVGNATVTITDTLPYEIDEEKSELNDGVYEAESKTITWEENIENIDTDTNGEKEISISKNIKVVYSNLNTEDEAFTNKTKGKIELNATKQTQETQEVQKETQTEFIKDVVVTTTWDHTNNIYGNPKRVILQVKNGDTVVQETEVNVENKVEENENVWSYTFTGLPKYNEVGEEIEYTAGEKEVEEGELAYYTSNINGLNITNTYNGPIISSAKTVTIPNDVGYAIPGEKIIYTITVTNAGGVAKDVEIKDTIPEGTTFVAGSIKVKEENLSEKTAEDLAQGITANVAEKQGDVNGQTALSYEVTINENTNGNIGSSSTIDGTTTEPVEIPVIKYEKTKTITRKNPESTLQANEVTAGDRITYTIKIINTGTSEVGKLEVKDNIPEGLELVEITNNGEQEENEITWQIESIPAKATESVSFTVEVKYSKEEYTITSVSTVDGKETNKVELLYKKPVQEIENHVEITGTNKITSKETKVYYEIKYTATVENFEGKAKVTIVDTLPYPIDTSKSEIQDGLYDENAKTITWVEEINNIDTFEAKQEKEIAITKALELSYNYGNINEITEKMINAVNTKIELQELKTETDYETIKEDNGEATKETQIEIPAKVVVHHYFHDTQMSQDTTQRLIKDDTIEGIIGGEYETAPSNKLLANYTCMNIAPEKHAGKMTEDIIEVSYYYQLKTPTITNEITQTVVANKEIEEDGKKVPVLTLEGTAVTYNIKYKTTVADYEGKGKIEIVDTIPAKIDISKSKLDGGQYDSEKNTITWVEELENITTTTITKQIQLVYVEQNLTHDLQNIVVGKTQVFYPENHPVSAGKVHLEKEISDEKTVKQQYTIDLKLVNEWDDSNNLKQKRPTRVKVQIKGTNTQEIELNEQNGWMSEIKGLEKYNKTNGEKIEYIITQQEVNEGDLSYYETPIITKTENANNYIFTITNAYKLIATDLQTEIKMQGTEKITASKQAVEYTITVTSGVVSNAENGKVKISATLPYKIEEEKSKLNGGTYDEEKQTITWEHQIGRTRNNQKLEVQKQISLVYKDLDATQEKIENQIKAKIEIYSRGEKDEKEANFETIIDIKGTVKVKYVDIKTGKEIAQGTTTTAKVGTPYETQKEEIEDYTFTKHTNNTSGTIKEGTQEVIYYYTSLKSNLIIQYVDEDGNKIAEDEIKEIKIGSSYKTTQKEFEGYEFVRVTDNKEGIMPAEDITVTYTYKKVPAKVIVKYINKETNEEIAPEDTINGFVKDKYETSRKVVKGYRAIDPEPENAVGTMIKDIEANNTITVIYYYERIQSGIITVRYVDVDTKKEITYKDPVTLAEKDFKYEIKGFVAEKYETEQKEIPYYNLVEVPTNATGELTESGDAVIYYYKKKAFNISVETQIQRVLFNGEEKAISNKKAIKVEIVVRDLEKTNLEVTYAIRVRNTGELAGTAKVVENVPIGYVLTTKNANYWKQNADGTLETLVDLKAGEEKLLEVTLKWENTQEFFGSSKNTVRVTDTSNEANFAETTLDDNTSTAEIITSVKTGTEEKIILIITTVGFIITACVLAYICKK